MSNFYLYSLLLSQGYQRAQIQLILHSFSLLSYSSPASFINLRNQSSSFRPLTISSSIGQHNYQSISGGNNVMQSKFTHLIQKNHQQAINKNIKQQQSLNQQNFSQSSSLNQQAIQCQKSKKGPKKKKIKKISLKQKRQKQMKRNQVQNANRNVIPNQIHQMISILFKKNKSQSLVHKLMSKFYNSEAGFQVSTLVKRFYLYQSMLKQKINHYANEQSLKVIFTNLEPSYKIYSEAEQNLYCKIGLILIKHFLDNEAALIILNSRRIKSQNKIEHLRTKRYLTEVLQQMKKSNYLK